MALGRLRQLWAPRDVEVGLGLGRPGLNSCLSGSNALQGCFFIGFRMDFFSGFGFVFSAKRFPLGFDGLCIKVYLKLRIARLCKCRFGRKAVISSHRVRLEKREWCQRGEEGGRTEVEGKWNQEPQFRGCQSYTTALSSLYCRTGGNCCRILDVGKKLTALKRNSA